MTFLWLRAHPAGDSSAAWHRGSLISGRASRRAAAIAEPFSSAPGRSSESVPLWDFLLPHFLMTAFLHFEPRWGEMTTAEWIGISLGHRCCPHFFYHCGEDTGPETPNSTPIHYPGCSCISKSRAESTVGLYGPFSWGPIWVELPGLRGAAEDRAGFPFSPCGVGGQLPFNACALCHCPGYIL